MEAELKKVPRRPYPCCNEPANCEVLPESKPDMKIERCKECGRKHYTVLADLGKHNTELT